VILRSSAASTAGTTFFGRLFGSSSPAEAKKAMSIARKKVDELSEFDKSKLDGYYVSIISLLSSIMGLYHQSLTD
jgi:hypothetical protein